MVITLLQKKKYTYSEFYNLLKSKEFSSIHLIVPEVFYKNKTGLRESLSGACYNCKIKINSGLHIDGMTADDFLVHGVSFTSVYFYRLKTIGMIRIEDSRFKGNVMFKGCKFYPIIDTLFSEFDDNFQILSTNFESNCTFNLCHFNQNVQFMRVSFNSNVSFIRSTFEKKVLFSDILFNKNADLSSVKFNDNVSFRRVTFSDTVSFYKTKFNNGIDLRRCNFDSVSAFYLEEFNYPIGKLFLNWEQISAKNKPRILIDNKPNLAIDNFKRLKNIYEKLIFNYETQGINNLVIKLVMS